MKKALALSGIVALCGLSACTAMTSTKDANSMSQIHDIRMRMRHGELVDVGPTNYGTRAVMMEAHPTTSVPANTNTTLTNAHDPSTVSPTAGNAPAAQMIDAPPRRGPASPTAGNMAPPVAIWQ